MTTTPDTADSIDFPLVAGGFDELLTRRITNSETQFAIRLTRVVVLVAVTWIPLLLLSLASGHAVSGRVDVPLLHDPALYGRFLFVLPVLELAEVVVALSLIVQVRHFIQSAIIPEQERTRFIAAVNEVIRIRVSIYAELAIAALAWGISITMRLIIMRGEASSWEHLDSSITPAGWWYALVSLPVLLFFLIRWLFIFSLWALFLFRVSRLDLRLTPTHPDHAGGLGFLGWGLASFASVLMAVSAVISAGFAYEILHGHESLDRLKYHVIVFVILAIIVIHMPLLAFAGGLSRLRFRGLLNYSRLVLRHDRAFDEKWIENPQPATKASEPLLGSSDVQSLADIATAYNHVDDMWLIPFDLKGFAVLVVSALLPMVPLIATVIPLNEILPKLLELLL
ncbi:hypothetical protein [Schlesneria paludicola]|uniref:hypothetical protein n=1 Tax=Schlesneria paludicola TaxID=360056 RepID=UPI00029A1E54|nr:hypothetical protein [Schlesneria paludicola]